LQLLLLRLVQDHDETVRAALRDALPDQPLGNDRAALAARVALAALSLGFEQELD